MARDLVNRPPSSRMSSARGLFWGMILFVVLVGGILVLAIFLLAPDLTIANLILPVSLQSQLSADYSPDNRALVIQPLSMELVAEAVRDRSVTSAPNSAAKTPVNFYPTLVEILKTPVGSVTPAGATPMPSPTAGAQPSLGATLTAVLQATATSTRPSATPGGSLTLAPTSSPTATYQPKGTLTPPPSRTAIVNTPKPTTAVPATARPTTAVSATARPTTAVPATIQPPTAVPPTAVPPAPTDVPPPEPTAYEPPPPPSTPYP